MKQICPAHFPSLYSQLLWNHFIDSTKKRKILDFLQAICPPILKPSTKRLQHMVRNSSLQFNSTTLSTFHTSLYCSILATFAVKLISSYYCNQLMQVHLIIVVTLESLLHTLFLLQDCTIFSCISFSPDVCLIQFLGCMR